MSLRETAVKGMSLVAGIKIFSAIANQATNVLLAILLLPTDFGIFAIGFLFIQIIANFSDFGIGRELIQRRDRPEEAIITGSVLRFFISIVLLVIGILVAPLVADFYDNDNITNVMRVLSLVFLFHFLGFIPRVSLSRQLQFARVVIPDTVGKLTKSFLAVALAYLGFNFWSLVVAAIVGNLVGVIGLYLAYPWKLRFRFDRDIARELFDYGKFVTSGALFLFLFHTIDDIIVGKVLGLSLLGSYVIAYTWGVFFPSSLNATISQVMFPIYSRIKNEKERLKKAFLLTIKYSAMISAPVCFGIVAFAPQFVMLVLGGTKWVDVIIPLRLLSFYGLHMVLTIPIEALYYAIGKPKQNLKFSLGRLGILLLPIYPAIVLFGIVGAAMTIVFVGVVLTVWMYWETSRELGVGVGEFINNAGAPIQASALAAGLIILSKVFLEPTLPMLAGMILAGGLLYLLFMVLLTRGKVISDVKEIIGLLGIMKSDRS